VGVNEGSTGFQPVRGQVGNLPYRGTCTAINPPAGGRMKNPTSTHAPYVIPNDSSSEAFSLRSHPGVGLAKEEAKPALSLPKGISSHVAQPPSAVHFL
jgi:hypothetical protein